jgi:hypothetical protein
MPMEQAGFRIGCGTSNQRKMDYGEGKGASKKV